MRRAGLRMRVTAGFASGALALSTLMAGVSYQLTRTSLLAERERAAVRATYFDAAVVHGGLDTPDPDIGNILRSLDTGGTRRALLRRDGTWYARTADANITSAIPGLMQRQVEHGEPSMQRVRSDRHAALVVGVPLSQDTWFYEVHSLEELDQTLKLLALVLTAVAIMVAAGGATLGWYAARYATRPLRSVADAAQRIADGDLTARLDPTPDPDLTRLTTSFNDMVSQLSRRMEADRRFAADVSHELRSPLQTLAAAASVLARRTPQLDQRTATAAGLVTDEVARFQSLVNDLLELARSDQSADRGLVGIAGLARQACQAYHLPEDLIIADSDDEPWWVDHRRVRQILGNLLDNAIKYGDGPTAIRLLATGEDYVIEVEDHGPGVDPEDRDIIFDRFGRGRAARARGAGAGAGLGLAIVAQHASAHGGRVTVHDRSDGGARFRVELPRQAP
ncbi:MAG: HAMP domain-containing histidine kinase [Micromonosporaceae bacterium]|nr:HAMP domain-containing histidine kinase [Micromonosporaceae bacterium]